MRKIGINLEAIPDVPSEAFIGAARAAGFTAMFTTTKDAPTTERISNEMAANGVTYETIHAPYKHINDMWGEGEAASASLRELCDTVDRCVQVGVPVAIVHLATKQAPLITEAGYRNFSSLVEYAAARNVTLAFENQRWLANLAWVFEYFCDAGNVQFCWDCGHEGCFSPGRQYMPLFAHKLCCVHLQDNNAEYNKDLHLIPFDGKLDFDRVARQIRESYFGGTLMLELKGRKSGYYDHLSLEEFLARAATAATRLRDMIDG